MTTPDHPDPLAPPTFGERVTRILGAVAGDPVARAEIDMARVLEELKSLGAEPIEDLTPEDRTYPGAGGELAARIYHPPGQAIGLRPLIAYYPGGGWVLSSLDDYDASARALSARSHATVVAFETRKAPENKFPAAHDDAVAAYRWLIDNAGELGGCEACVALVGESAGGNLAINVAIAARDREMTPPIHLALIYPLAGVDMTTPSFRINEFARPVNKAMIGWYLGHALMGVDQKDDPRLDLVGRADLSGLPPTTILTAEIDPLRSEGLDLANKLRASGVSVNAFDFEGVSHGFFGMGDLVRHARSAQEIVARDLAASFGAEERGCRAGRAM